MRFTTVDPIKDSNIWYAYVGNDPINFIDPYGLCAESDNQVADSLADQITNDLIDLTQQRLDLSNQISDVQQQIREEIGFQQGAILDTAFEIGTTIGGIASGHSDPAQAIPELVENISQTTEDFWESNIVKTPALASEKVGLENELNAVSEIIEMREAQLEELDESGGYLYGQF